MQLERLAKGAAIVALVGALSISPAAAHVPQECRGQLDRMVAEYETTLVFMRDVNDGYATAPIGDVVSSLEMQFHNNWAFIGALEELFECLGQPLHELKR